MDLPGEGILDGDRLAGIIDEELFSCPIFLAQANIELLGPLTVKSTKLTVLVTVGVGLLIFMPEQLQGYSLLAQFLKQVVHRRHFPFVRGGDGWSEETRGVPWRPHPVQPEGARKDLLAEPGAGIL